ncbi:MAG: sensor domain-containing diguanylate cyclase [Chromatiaceae bacterium]|nr:sensor domain-containing diguanylate cyclase [Chromatiaceae bacterium]
MPTPQPDNQTQSLDFENRRLRQKLAELTEEARQSEETFRRCHQRELLLMGAEDLPQLLQALTVGLQRSFRLTAISLVLPDPNHELRHLLANSGNFPCDSDQLFFCDHPTDFSPIYGSLRRSRLGPYLGEEHGRLFPGRDLIRSVAMLPMTRHNQLVGILNLGSQDPNRFTRHHATDFLDRLATIGAVCLESAANREHLVISGLTDALTGMHNRRYLEKRLSEEIARSRRYNQPLCCLFIDADHFKRVNDLHGHAIGDLVLRETSLRIGECLRASDVATRYGGEEFALLLPQTDPGEAFKIAERIRTRVAREPVSLEQGTELTISVSIGISSLNARGGEEPAKTLLHDADAALYEAKRLGRNRTVKPVQIDA